MSTNDGRIVCYEMGTGLFNTFKEGSLGILVSYSNRDTISYYSYMDGQHIVNNIDHMVPVKIPVTKELANLLRLIQQL